MFIQKYCLQCGEMLPAHTPPAQLYCSDGCQQRLNRAAQSESLPETIETKELDGEEEGGVHPLVLLGLLGVGAWLLRPAPKSSPGASSTQPKQVVNPVASKTK